jgi:hypothetical protein
MADQKTEALQVLGTLKTPGWRVIEQLFDAAVNQFLSASHAPSKTLDEATTKALHAQGAWGLANNFKLALLAARDIAADPNAGGLPAQESNDAAN